MGVPIPRNAPRDNPTSQQGVQPMNVYIYQADIYCEDCGKAMIAISKSSTLGNREDSNDYPQGPYADGGGEADCPQHCGGCGVFLESPLSSWGYAYVREALDANRHTKAKAKGQITVLQQWADFYRNEDDALDAAITEFDNRSPSK
jgi:hypothetical protein